MTLSTQLSSFVPLFTFTLQRSDSSSSLSDATKQVFGIGLPSAGGAEGSAGSAQSNAAASINAATIDWAAKAREWAENARIGAENAGRALDWLNSPGGAQLSQSGRDQAIQNAEQSVRVAQGLYDYYSSGEFEDMMTAISAARAHEPVVSKEERAAAVAEMTAMLSAFRERMTDEA